MVLANTTFVNIFLITGSKMTGLTFVIGPFVLPGFCSGGRSLKPVYIKIITYTVIQYTCNFFKEFFRTVLNHFSCYFIISWYSVVVEFHNNFSDCIKCYFMF